MLALLYDIHGNLPALEAVLDDCPAERFLLGGDYVVAGAWPAETLDRLRELEATWIRGNTDRWLEDAPDAPESVQGPLAYARERLGEERAAELAGLREIVEIDGTLYCHASPHSDMESFPEDGEDGVEADPPLLQDVSAPRVVFGHTHLQFARPGPGGVELINPGSVGLPWDHDHRAAYGLVHDDGRYEERRVEYDWRRSAAAAREHVDDLVARRIEQARFVPTPC